MPSDFTGDAKYIEKAKKLVEPALQSIPLMIAQALMGLHFRQPTRTKFLRERNWTIS